MGSYAKCLQTHAHLGGRIDGCQKFKAARRPENCSICGCHMNFHKRVREYETEVVYTECHKIHSLNGFNTKDGCKKFVAGYAPNDHLCAACKCHQSFHRNEVTKEVILSETDSEADSETGFRDGFRV